MTGWKTEVSDIKHEKEKKDINWYTGFIPLLVIVITGLVHGFVGNPVSKVIAGKTFDKYINEKYPGCIYEDCSYDFTCNGYVAIITSPDNPDIRVILKTDTLGTKITGDNYAAAVEGGWNTSRRLNEEYTQLLNSMVGEEILGYEIYSLKGYFVDDETTAKATLKEGPLVPGGVYDVYRLSETDGDIVIRVAAPGADKTVAVHIFTEMKRVLLESSLKFDTATVCIGADNDCWPYIVELTGILYDGSNLPEAQ